MIHVFRYLFWTSYNTYQMAYLISSLWCLKFNTPNGKPSIFSFTPAHPMIFSSFSIIFTSVDGPSRAQSVILWELLYSFSSYLVFPLPGMLLFIHGHGSLLLSWRRRGSKWHDQGYGVPAAPHPGRKLNPCHGSPLPKPSRHQGEGAGRDRGRKEALAV